MKLFYIYKNYFIMNKVILLLLITILFSCKTEEEFTPRQITTVEIENILNDSLLSIRAIDLLNDGSLTFAANKGTFGLRDVKSEKWVVSNQVYDTLKLEFRAIAHTANDFFMLSVGSPALLYKTGGGGNMEVVYKEDHPKAFYDAMSFWNDKEGIAMGDPTDDCISIIITRDGGYTWTKLSCDDLPKAVDGEAAFAASNSNIAISGDHTWIATGGMSSRILYSADKGRNWDIYETPIIQGKNTTGMYSVDFYDDLHGFAIGGDYTKPEDNQSNKIVTTDGGKTWSIVAKGETPNYRSCVQYFPNRAGKELVAVGFEGIDYSNDSGATWTHLSDESFFTLRFINDSTAYAAGRGRISKLKFSK